MAYSQSYFTIKVILRNFIVEIQEVIVKIKHLTDKNDEIFFTVA